MENIEKHFPKTSAEKIAQLEQSDFKVKLYQNIKSILEKKYAYPLSKTDTFVIYRIIEEVVNEVKKLSLQIENAKTKEEKEKAIAQYNNAVPSMYESEVIARFIDQRFGINVSNALHSFSEEELGKYMKRLREKEEML